MANDGDPPAPPGSPARPRRHRLADRVSAVFVPVVVALAVATLGFWLGGGARKLGTSNARTPTSHSTITPTMVATG